MTTKIHDVPGDARFLSLDTPEIQVTLSRDMVDAIVAHERKRDPESFYKADLTFEFVETPAAEFAVKLLAGCTRIVNMPDPVARWDAMDRLFSELAAMAPGRIVMRQDVMNLPR